MSSLTNPKSRNPSYSMKRFFRLTILAMSLTLAIACESAESPDHDSPAPIANLSLSMSPGSGWTASAFGRPPIGVNVAPRGFASGSSRDHTGLLSVDAETAISAIDGDIQTWWSSLQPAPQWFSVILDDLYLVDRIQLLVTQAPPGPTSHEIWLGNGSGTRTLFRRLVNVPTSEGRILSVEVNPPQIVSEVFILTRQSPSWVAWREISVFGLPVTQHVSTNSLPRLTLQPVTFGLEKPGNVTHAGDDSQRLFVAERVGRIRIVKNDILLSEPFLDITDRVLDITDRVRCCGPQGLLDMAFPPSFSDSKQFYVSYTDGDGHTIISRFQTTENPDIADPDSEEIVLIIEQPAELHNGGNMAFGPRDGFLYISSGDGGSFSYPENPALENDTFYSKLLRIDVESDVKPYLIPDSNPFKQKQGFLAETWAQGLRHPGKFAFDQATGDLYIPDSGNRRREEINFQPAASPGGEDYGWFKMEGILCFDNFVVPCSADGLTLPVAEYDHSLGCSVSGGVVFRGPGFPALQGQFLYADLCSGRLWGLEKPAQDQQHGWQSTLLLNAPISISSIGQDQVGNVFLTSFQDGTLYSLTERSSSARNGTAFRENLALQGSGLASSGSTTIEFAFDGNPETAWNATEPPPQWYSVILEDYYQIDRIELAASQDSFGPTTIELWLANGSGTRTLFKRLSDIRPARDGIIEIPVDPPQIANEVLVLSLQSTDDVSWQEVKVYGSPTDNVRPEDAAPKVKLERFADGLELPVLIAHAGDGSGRLFVAEQKGKIRTIKDGRLLDTPFLDISDRVICCGERGLVGLAFPPGFIDKQHFYVSYTNTEGHTTLSRFRTSEDLGRADPDSEETVLVIEQPHRIHNGGYLAFGPRDGFLYIGSGDGGTFHDPDYLAQKPDTLLGKILRIDVESESEPYVVPPDNPFSHTDGYRKEIWALGLRNPWGFAFDRLTGDLYIPDVGDAKQEEVNFQAAQNQAGQNFGWPAMEGNLCFEHDSLDCNANGLTLPVAEYDHSRGCAIVGGAVYRSAVPTGLDGMFLFADFCRGYIWGLRPIVDAATGQAESKWHSSLLAYAGFPVSGLGEDEEGNIYVAAYQHGTIYRITER